MLLHTDIPTRAHVEALLQVRRPWCVSVHLPTDPVSSGAPERIAFGNHAAGAVQRLRERGASRDDVSAVEEHLGDLADDPDIWGSLARSLVVFADPASLTTFRLPNRLSARVQVADRFSVTPLLRTLTFPQLAYVLALGQNSVRLLEVLPDAPPYEVRVPDLPGDIVDAVGVPSVRGRGHRGRLHGSEGRKVRMGQYTRRIDQALRPILSDGIPLVLAANEPLASIYRSSASYPHLAATTLRGNAETTSDADLAAEARNVLDEVYSRQLRELRDTVEERDSRSRAVFDVAGIARAATWGTVDTLLVDIDDATHGTVDDAGAVALTGDGPDVEGPRLLDEVVQRVWAAGGRVLAVRRADIPHGGPAAAILRFSPS